MLFYMKVCSESHEIVSPSAEPIAEAAPAPHSPPVAVQWNVSALEAVLPAPDEEDSKSTMNEYELDTLPAAPRRARRRHLVPSSAPRTQRLQFNDNPLLPVIHVLAIDLVVRHRQTRRSLSSMLHLLHNHGLATPILTDLATKWFPRYAKDVIAYITAKVPRDALGNA